MPLSRDEIYHLIAIAKGDSAASAEQLAAARLEYRELIDQWTRQMQRAQPADLSITHESVRERVEAAYQPI